MFSFGQCYCHGRSQHAVPSAHQFCLLQVTVSSVAQTQQSQDFLASQAATQKLQEQLTQTQQSCEAAAADERALDQAHRHVVLGCQLACMPLVHCLFVSAFPSWAVSR